MTTDEIRLVIPAEEDFRPIAHLVTGGLAMRLDVTYDDLDDLQVGIEALLALRDDADELVVSLSADDGVLHASLGPFPPEKVHAADSDGEHRPASRARDRLRHARGRGARRRRLGRAEQADQRAAA